MTKQYQEGDKVRSRKGGPPMVVDFASAHFASCLVLTESGLRQKLFPHGELVPAEAGAAHAEPSVPAQSSRA